MTKEEYLKKLEDIVDIMNKISERTTTISTADSISMLKLQFDIITAMYNYTKEEKVNESNKCA